MTLAQVVRQANAQNACLVNLWANSPRGLRYVGTWTVDRRTLTCMGKTFAQVRATRSVRGETRLMELDWTDLQFSIRAHRSAWVLKARTSTAAVMGR